eukprot:17434-Heterococcus_DN1.PRE.1
MQCCIDVSARRGHIVRIRGNAFDSTAESTACILDVLANARPCKSAQPLLLAGELEPILVCARPDHVHSELAHVTAHWVSIAPLSLRVAAGGIVAALRAYLAGLVSEEAVVPSCRDSAVAAAVVVGVEGALCLSGTEVAAVVPGDACDAPLVYIDDRCEDAEGAVLSPAPVPLLIGDYPCALYMHSYVFTVFEMKRIGLICSVAPRRLPRTIYLHSGVLVCSREDRNQAVVCGRSPVQGVHN